MDRCCRLLRKPPARLRVSCRLRRDRGKLSPSSTVRVAVRVHRNGKKTGEKVKNMANPLQERELAKNTRAVTDEPLRAFCDAPRFSFGLSGPVRYDGGVVNG